MPVSEQGQVRPNFIGDHIDIIGPKNLHCLFQLPAFPHPPGGVVGGTEQRRVNMVFSDLPLHILIVHAPDAICVLLQRAEDEAETVALQLCGEASIGRGMDKYRLPFGTQYPQGAGNAAQHAIFITDSLTGQALYAVDFPLPPEDGVVVFIAGDEVTVNGMLDALCQCLGYRGRGGEVHIRDPHGDFIETGFCDPFRNAPEVVFVHIGGNRIHAPPVQHGRKIKVHVHYPPAFDSQHSFVLLTLFSNQLSIRARSTLRPNRT